MRSTTGSGLLFAAALMVLFLPAAALAVYDMEWFDLNHWRAPFYNDGRWGIDITQGPGAAGGAWPSPLHNCYVFGAGPWVGGILGSDTAVTVGYNPNSGGTECWPTLNRYWREGSGNPEDRIYKYPGDWPPPQGRFPMAPQQPRSDMDMWCCFGDSNAANHVAGWEALDVAVLDSYAYVATSGGLLVLEVADPQNPSEAGICDSMLYARGVAVAGSYAYVAGYNGLFIIDVTDPWNPLVTGSYPTTVYGVAVVGSYAYLAAGASGLRILDVADPYYPYLAGIWNTPGIASGVAVSDSYAYVADGEAGLRVINVSDPTNPYEEGSCETPDSAAGIAVMDGRACVADRDSGLRAINLASPQSPYEEGHCDVPGRALDVAVVGSNAFVAGDDSGLRVIDISNPQTPAEVGFYDTPGLARGVAAADSHVYVADGTCGLRVVDVADPRSPREVGRRSAAGRPLGIDVYLTVYGYSDTLAQDFFFLKYELANSSGDSLRRAYFGMALDADVGDATDDMTGLILDHRFGVGPDTFRVWNTGFAYDYNNRENAGSCWESGTPGAVAVTLLAAPGSLGLTAFKKLSIDIDPVTDVAQYQTLAGYDYRTGEYSPFDSVDEIPADKRALLASGPFDLAPDSVVTFWYAVIGAAFGTAGQPPEERDTSELALGCQRVRDYFERLIGLAELPAASLIAQPIATVVRGMLFLPGTAGRGADATGLLDICGRKVMALRPGANDVSRLAPGTYFVCEGSGKMQKVILTR